MVWPSPPRCAPRAAGARTQLLAVEADRRAGLDHLDRHRGDPGRVRAGRQPGLGRPGSDAPGVGEHGRDERTAVVVVAADLHGPHRPEPSAMAWSGFTWASALSSALGRNMPTTWRAVPGCGRHRVDDAALRRLDLYRRQAAVVVGDLGVQHAAHRKRRVRVGVVLDHVDAVRAGPGRALVVDQHLPRLGVDGERDADVDLRAVGQVQPPWERYVPAGSSGSRPGWPLPTAR